MVKKFEAYYQKHQLFEQSNKILLAVSGGKDSMAMFHLFRLSNLNFGVAHCNFNLRGAASDADEQLVKLVCEKYKVPFFVNYFNTIAYAEQEGISIQMAARELRYNWFDKIRVSNGYDFIATAHHKNDVAETMLINLVKGTGIAGLHGIKSKTNKIIRPILGISRKEIDAFIKENNINFRDDQSNFNNKYIRNNIRLDVVPLLEKINPNLINNLNKTSNYIADAELIIEEKIKESFNYCSNIKENKIYFDITKLKALTAITTQLFYFLKPYGFNGSDIDNIVESFEEQHSGKKFFSKTHLIIKDRNNLILQEIDEDKPDIVINSIDELEAKLSWKVSVQTNKAFKPKRDVRYANLDFDKIQFPLTIRNWKEGDAFQPYGMKGRKKLSDFFIDNKVDVVTKKQIQLLISNKQIIWVVGFRIDDKFKITDKSKKVFLIDSNPTIC